MVDMLQMTFWDQAGKVIPCKAGMELMVQCPCWILVLCRRFRMATMKLQRRQRQHQKVCLPIEGLLGEGVSQRDRLEVVAFLLFQRLGHLENLGLKHQKRLHWKTILWKRQWMKVWYCIMLG